MSTTAATSLPAAETVCATLAKLGARHVFGLPGTQTTTFYEALRRSPLEAVVPTHELAAAFMAGAYSSLPAAGRACCRRSPDPASPMRWRGSPKQSSTAPRCSTSSMRRPRPTVPGYGLQALDQRGLLAPVTKAHRHGRTRQRCRGGRPHGVGAGARRRARTGGAGTRRRHLRWRRSG